METKDNEQYSTPQNAPKPEKPDPQMPGDEKENNVRSGAEQEDQLEKLKPENEEDKAPNKLGNPPVDHVEDGS